MKTSRALPLLALLLAGSAVGALSLSGCSSSSSATTPPADDTGSADTGTVTDTGTKPDTADAAPKPDTGPISCATDLATDYACATPKIPAGGTVCTETMIQEFDTACFGGDATTCAAWTKKYADCDKCTGKFLSAGGWVESGYCMQALAPTSTCGKLSVCNIDCYETVCETCDTTDGSGRTASTSEYQDCIADAQFAGSASRPKGRCYDIVTKALKTAACTTTAPTDGCTDVIQFFRGACRDNADWSHMTDPAFGATDAGTDTGGATDAADAG
jgi:hypothetical protein